MTTEAKTVSGAGTFTTSTSYDAADRVRTLSYPETVTNGYSAAQGLEPNPVLRDRLWPNSKVNDSLKLKR